MNFQMGPKLRQYAVVITANLTVFCVGLGLVWPSPVLVKLRDQNQTVLTRPITEEEGSWIVSIGYLCSVPVIFIAPYLVDILGRKYTLIITLIPRIAVCLLFNCATEVWMIIFARAIQGLADTIVFIAVPIYASEIASKEIRGSLGSILQISCSLGIVLMFSFGPILPYVTLNIIFTALVVVTSIPLLFIPDSPYFLYSKGKEEETIKVLTYLRGSESIAKEELKELALAAEETKIDKKELIKDRTFLKTVGIVNVISMGTQLVGFNAVTFYLQTVLESTQTSVKPELASAVVGLIQITAAVGTTAITDRFGRKPILAITLVGQAVGMVGLGIFFKLKENSDQISGFMNFVPLMSLILVVYAYSAGLGSLGFLLSAELFHSPARALGMCMTSVISIIFLFLTTKYFALLTTALGPAITYWFFSVNCLLLCMFILFVVPETKGKSFSEIQRALSGRIESEPKDCDVRL